MTAVRTPKPAVRVRHRGGWCLASRKRTTRYQDSVHTLCGYWITLPWGIKTSGDVTCPECIERVRQWRRT